MSVVFYININGGDFVLFVRAPLRGGPFHIAHIFTDKHMYGSWQMLLMRVMVAIDDDYEYDYKDVFYAARHIKFSQNRKK